ncbi:hypothetical protein NKH18_33140 [Streptomyces sp. M10(2022)]
MRRNITATPQAVQLRPRPELPWPADWPTVRLYPLVDHIADKICAMYEWHGTTLQPLPRPRRPVAHQPTRTPRRRPGPPRAAHRGSSAPLRRRP